MKKKVSKRRTTKEVLQDEAMAKKFATGFAFSLILLCQAEDLNGSAQEIFEIRCKDVFDDAGYSWDDLQGLDLDPSDLAMLRRIFFQ